MSRGAVLSRGVWKACLPHESRPDACCLCPRVQYHSRILPRSLSDERPLDVAELTDPLRKDARTHHRPSSRSAPLRSSRHSSASMDRQSISAGAVATARAMALTVSLCSLLVGAAQDASVSLGVAPHVPDETGVATPPWSHRLSRRYDPHAVNTTLELASLPAWRRQSSWRVGNLSLFSVDGTPSVSAAWPTLMPAQVSFASDSTAHASRSATSLSNLRSHRQSVWPRRRRGCRPSLAAARAGSMATNGCLRRTRWRRIARATWAGRGPLAPPSWNRRPRSCRVTRSCTGCSCRAWWGRRGSSKTS